MPYSLCGKRLAWKRPLQPSGSAAQTKKPVRAATDMAMAHSLFFNDVGCVSEEVYDVHAMGHMAPYPNHYWRSAQQFWDAIGAP